MLNEGGRPYYHLRRTKNKYIQMSNKKRHEKRHMRKMPTME